MFETYQVPKNLIPSDPRFGVGPSLIPISSLEQLLATGTELIGTSHRKPAVQNLCGEVQDGLRKYFNLPSDYEVIMGNGGATFLFDMIGLGLVKKSSVHYTTGEFSSKWFKAHSLVPFIETKEITTEVGKGINPEALAGHDMVCCTLNETSTGVMINSIPDGVENTILAVDATSGAGQISLDFNKVDLYFFSPQKVFASEGGFYIAIMSPKAIKRAKDLYERDTYRPEVMSWKNAIDNSLKSQTYNTPAISTIFFLNEQIKTMNTLGEKKVLEMARAKADLVYSWATKKEYLSCYIKEEEFRSNAVATINLDDKYNAIELANSLRSQGVVYDIDAYRKLGLNQFRISLFHNITIEDLEKLTLIISDAVEGVN
jgi:phosphoserine aminotransferase